jgi:hypothetical protein
VSVAKDAAIAAPAVGVASARNAENAVATGDAASRAAANAVSAVSEPNAASSARI